MLTARTTSSVHCGWHFLSPTTRMPSIWETERITGSSQALIFISSYCFKLFQLQFTLTVSKSCFTESSISLFHSHQMWDVKSGVDTKEQAVLCSLHTWFAVCWCAPVFGKPLSHWLNETNSSIVKVLFIFLATVLCLHYKNLHHHHHQSQHDSTRKAASHFYGQV